MSKEGKAAFIAVKVAEAMAKKHPEVPKDHVLKTVIEAEQRGLLSDGEINRTIRRSE